MSRWPHVICAELLYLEQKKRPDGEADRLANSGFLGALKGGS